MHPILFIGSNQYGGDARSCADSLRRLGWTSSTSTRASIFRLFKSIPGKIGLRLARRGLVAEFNREVLDIAAHYPHDIFLALKERICWRNSQNHSPIRRISL